MNKIIALLLVLGACSSDGSSGSMGSNGSDGVVGPAGPQGPAGPAGPEGPRGPQGMTGAQGVAGPKGDPGVTGAQGLPGSVGPQGPAGTNGTNGVNGTPGAPGATGAQGPQGPVGPKGATGAAGASGLSSIVYTVNGARLGLLVNANPGMQTYVAYGDEYTLVPDGYVVSMASATVWYTNNDCTGQAYVDQGTYVQFANAVYMGAQNKLYTAPTGAGTNVAVGSKSTLPVGTACTASSQGITGHALTTVGSPISLSASLPWHVVIE